MLTRIGAAAVRWAAAHEPHGNVYGVARTLIALGSLGTFLFSPVTSVFHPAVGIPVSPPCPASVSAGLFCVVGEGRLELARWITIAVLMLVASGWRPRITGVLHWYVTWSFMTSATMVDGGDQAAGILALILLPVTLLDGRRWHWDAIPTASLDSPTAWMKRILALSCLLVARIQVAGIYLHAAVGKMPVEEWRDGTATYYWFNNPWFGLPDYLAFARPWLANPLVAAGITWGAIVLELFLFAALLMDRRHRWMLLLAGVGFHAAIAVSHGLLSFSLVMSGALVLYLRPLEQPFALPAWARRLAALRLSGLPRPGRVPDSARPAGA